MGVGGYSRGKIVQCQPVGSCTDFTVLQEQKCRTPHTLTPFFGLSLPLIPSLIPIVKYDQDKIKHVLCIFLKESIIISLFLFNLIFIPFFFLSLFIIYHCFSVIFSFHSYTPNSRFSHLPFENCLFKNFSGCTTIMIRDMFIMYFN